MNKYIIILVLIIFVVPALMQADEIDPAFRTDMNNLAVSGAVCNYTGMGLEITGVVLMTVGSNFGYLPMFMGMFMFAAGIITESIVAPILYINAYLKMQGKNLIDNELYNNSGFLYGMSWVAYGTGFLLNLPFMILLLMQQNKNYEKYSKVLTAFSIVIMSVAISAIYALRGVAVTVPLMRVAF